MEYFYHFFLMTAQVYSALMRKLNSLPKEVLMKLHANMSFMEPETKMMEMLTYLQAPSRHAMFGMVRNLSYSFLL
jgi:hypothetical protein